MRSNLTVGICGRDPLSPATRAGFIIATFPRAYAAWLYADTRYAGLKPILRHGYADKNGIENRMNFGGVHKTGVRQALTNLEMQLIGFDVGSGKIRSTNGRIALLDRNNVEAASWSFSSLLLHWNRKHNQACYVPSMSETQPERQYKYGKNLILGTGTDFQLFLGQMANGNIYYDPGIKMENISSRPKIKKRSQFRIKSQYLKNLYKVNEIVDVSNFD